MGIRLLPYLLLDHGYSPPQSHHMMRVLASTSFHKDHGYSPPCTFIIIGTWKITSCSILRSMGITSYPFVWRSRVITPSLINYIVFQSRFILGQKSFQPRIIHVSKPFTFIQSCLTIHCRKYPFHSTTSTINNRQSRLYSQRTTSDDHHLCFTLKQ